MVAMYVWVEFSNAAASYLQAILQQCWDEKQQQKEATQGVARQQGVQCMRSST